MKLHEFYKGITASGIGVSATLSFCSLEAVKRFFIFLACFTLAVWNVSAQVVMDKFTVTDPNGIILSGPNDVVSVFSQTDDSSPGINFSDPTASFTLLNAGAPILFQDPGVLSLNFDNSQSTLTAESAAIPAGIAGYQLIINLKSSIPNIQFEESQSVSVFDLENSFTLIRSDGVNITSDTGTVSEFEVAASPEPSTWAMLLCGLGFLAFCGYRKKKLKAVLVVAERAKGERG